MAGGPCDVYFFHEFIRYGCNSRITSIITSVASKSSESSAVTDGSLFMCAW